MCDNDDSFNVPTVPRYGKFGGLTDEDEDGDTETTLGDRFFDMLQLQTNTISKTESGRFIKLRDKQNNAVETQPISAATGADSQNEDSSQDIQGEKKLLIYLLSSYKFLFVQNENDLNPFELNRLAMFRPPARLSGRRSNSVTVEENTIPSSKNNAEIKCSGRMHQKPVENKNTMKNSNIAAGGQYQCGMKTMRSSVLRPQYPNVIRVQRSLSREQKPPPSSSGNEVKAKMIGSMTGRYGSVRVRAASGEPGLHRGVGIGTIRTNGTLKREVINDTTNRMPARLPIRVRSASTDSGLVRNNAVKTGTMNAGTGAYVRQSYDNKSTTTTNAISSVRNMISGGGAKKSPYLGPETRARARMKQSKETRVLPDVVNNNSTRTMSQTEASGKKVKKVRPLSQQNSNLQTARQGTSDKNIAPSKEVEGGHRSRPRTRTSHGPIRVQSTQQGATKNKDLLPPVISESHFRQSVTRRPKGGDSLERDVTQGSDKENADIWTFTKKKETPILEFAPCLRSRVAANKGQNGTAGASSTTFPKNVPPRACNNDVTVRQRRTAAERDAFFRRLSTPKSIANIKKGTK